MTCKCKAQFCYICGLKWRTCACSDAQLQAVLQAAIARRNAAQARERQAQTAQQAAQAAITAAARAAEREAAELREILQEIEDFEMEEAERFAREEEELRLAAIASRQRRQEEQIVKISKKYFDLKSELEFLHDIQKVAMAQRYDDEVQMIRNHANIRGAILHRHAMELQLAESVSDAKISDSQFRFDQDYQTRLAHERRQEDEYREQLRVHYDGKENAATLIEDGMEALRTRNSERYQTWNEVKRKQHQQVVAVAKEEVERFKRRHELELEATQNRMEGNEKDIQARRTTDNKWFDAVVGVRARMLDEMEEQEYSLELNVN
jgi:hypothetical protein